MTAKHRGQRKWLGGQPERLLGLFEKLPPAAATPWLPRHAELAFLLCVASGPWAHNRRQTIQARAVEWYRTHCPQGFNSFTACVVAGQPFPLEWQTAMLTQALVIAKNWRPSFAYYSADEFFTDFGYTAHTAPKVLYMYVRDYMGMPACAVDRHVRRQLVAHKLPTNQANITALCRECGVDASELSRRLFAGVNPDWRHLR